MGSVLVWGIVSGVGQGKESSEAWLGESSSSKAVGAEYGVFAAWRYKLSGVWISI